MRWERYHGHSGVQRADGLYGGLVVHEPQPSTDEEAIPEQLLMVGDWYHRTSKEVRDWFLDPGQYGYEVCSAGLDPGHLIRRVNRWGVNW